jgi:tetratricopeptide (TPR) repeat protein
VAYSVREERQSLATSLREDLGEAERMIVQLRRDTVEQFLQLLDRIEDRFAQLESSGLDLRPEFTRWGSLQSKLRREAGRVVRIIDVAGGLDQLRQANPPAEGLWWRLDAVVAEARRRLVRRLSITLGTIVVVVAVVWALLTFVFPPDPNTVVASEAISTLQQLAFEGRWEEALAVIEDAKSQLTQPDAELLIWEGVIRGKLGQHERAGEALAEAKSLVPAGKLVAYWWSLGSVQLSVGNLEEARASGFEAIDLDDSDPQGYFLLASVAEMKGDTVCAVDLFEETFQLAADNNPQLAVIARVRMGNLLQRPANLALLGGDEEESDGNSESGEGGSPADSAVTGLPETCGGL